MMATLALLAACGSGGGESSTTTDNPETPAACQDAEARIYAGEVTTRDLIEEGCFPCEGDICAWTEDHLVRQPLPCLREGAETTCYLRFTFDFCERYGPDGLYPNDRFEWDLIADIYDASCV